MNRRTARERAFLFLFSACFEQEVNWEEQIEAARKEEEFAVDSYGEFLLRSYAQHQAEVDGQIDRRLKGWKADRLPRVNLSILRLAVTEMLYGEPGMDSVVINEAVELAKKYGDDGDYQFVNGLLGSVARGNEASFPQQQEDPGTANGGAEPGGEA